MPLANVLVETFLKGGPIMWPILVCLIVALATVAERLLYWRNVRRLRADKAFSEALWEVRLGQYGGLR
jgi:biopolymer transport protein ExbB